MRVGGGAVRHEGAVDKHVALSHPQWFVPCKQRGPHGVSRGRERRRHRAAAGGHDGHGERLLRVRVLQLLHHGAVLALGHFPASAMVLCAVVRGAAPPTDGGGRPSDAGSRDEPGTVRTPDAPRQVRQQADDLAVVVVEDHQQDRDDHHHQQEQEQQQQQQPPPPPQLAVAQGAAVRRSLLSQTAARTSAPALARRGGSRASARPLQGRRLCTRGWALWAS
eukprot:scaffold843_cov327-Prasinococcus_capsulatus_cf.AAC.13